MFAVFSEPNSEHTVCVLKDLENGVLEIRIVWEDPGCLVAVCISFPWKAVLQFPNSPPSTLQSTEGSALILG